MALPIPIANASLFVACSAVGLGLRLLDIGRESLWLDEAARVALASLPLGEIPRAVSVIELSPPLYHLVLHAWMEVAGGGDVAVRVFSALMVIPAVALAWRLGYWLAGRATGFAMGALAAASPLAVHFGQEAAMYGLLLPLALGALVAGCSFLEGDKRRDWGLGAGGWPLIPNPQPPNPSGWLALYAVLSACVAYTHYYGFFLLACLGAAGLVRLAMMGDRRRLGLWLLAHAAVGLACVPWVPVALRQAQLAASVEEWGGVSLLDAVGKWATALLAYSGPSWLTVLSLTVVVAACGAGAWRLRGRPWVAWLLLALVVIPLVLATVASGPLHAFRERGFVAVFAAVWALMAAAVFAGAPRGLGDRVFRAGLGLTLVAITGSGLVFQHAERKEGWRLAAARVAEGAGPSDPVFFVHYGAQVPFDRYFSGPQPRVGLPESFSWEAGFSARYRVDPADVQTRAAAALTGKQWAWAVLSHDAGRGSEHLVAYLEGWGEQVSPDDLYGIRVLGYRRR